MPKTRTKSGVEIRYEVRGEGPPLLLISGTGHDHTFWSGQAPRFEQEFRCVVFDNRGVGESDAPPPGYSLADMADDAAAVLDAAGIEQAHVMGFSMGGHIAQELCLRYPARVLSLGLHHTWTKNCPLLESFQLARKRLAEHGDLLALAEMSLLGLHAHDYRDAHAEELEQKKQWLVERSGPSHGWVGQLQACVAGDTWDRLQEIRAPTLVSGSDRDLIMDPHHAREIHAGIAGSRLVVLEGTGHVALIERPGEFAELCLGFLRDLQGELVSAAKPDQQS